MKEKTVQGLTRELANGKTFLKIDKKIAMR